MMNTNAELRVDLANKSLVAVSPTQPPLKNLAKIKHIFSPNVYIKAFFVPASIRLVTKEFHEDHVTILAKGSVLMEDPQGKKIKYVAPVAIQLKAHSRYRVVTLEEAVWYCVHPTDETDQGTLIKQFE